MKILVLKTCNIITDKEVCIGEPSGFIFSLRFWMYSVSQVYSSSGGAEGCSAVASTPSIASDFGTGASTSAIADYIASGNCSRIARKKVCCGLLSKRLRLHDFRRLVHFSCQTCCQEF